MPRIEEIVTTDLVNGVRVITVDHASLNAHGLAVLAGIAQALRDASSAGEAVVIACAGCLFLGETDIAEFGEPSQEPTLRRVIERIEDHPEPVVAAIQGKALGVGLEITLGCHARIATPDAQLGLPAVKLGLLPGAGGTQRLPRLIGVDRALDMIVSGDPIAGVRALEIGLVDELAPEAHLTAAAITLAARLASGGCKGRLRDCDERIRGVDPAVFERKRADIARKTRGLIAPDACIRAVEAATTLGFDDGMRLEQELFDTLQGSVESQSQRHLVFAEREASKIPDIGKEVQARPVRAVGVIGAGTMGTGIAMAFANGGVPVVLVETTEEAVQRGLATIRKNYESTLKRGGVSSDDLHRRLRLISGSTAMSDLRDADLIVEAVFEDMAVKKRVFADLAKYAKPTAILATNTSTLDVDEIARSADDPSRVIGLHFFSPANVMRLLEIVRGEATAKDVVATALAIARTIDKTPVVVGVCDGFVGNRMLAQQIREAERLLMTGALPHEVDRVLVAFGFPMGPFAMSDFAGLDVGYQVRQARGTPMAIADALYEAGRYGRKVGRGYYRYEPGSRVPVPDPDVEQIILSISERTGVVRKSFNDEEILERLICPMINEGHRILNERIALRESDIDVVWVQGYGWPVRTGGPMFHGKRIGHEHVRSVMRKMHVEFGDAALEPAL